MITRDHPECREINARVDVPVAVATFYLGLGQQPEPTRERKPQKTATLLLVSQPVFRPDEVKRQFKSPACFVQVTVLLRLNRGNGVSPESPDPDLPTLPRDHLQLHGHSLAARRKAEKPPYQAPQSAVPPRYHKHAGTARTTLTGMKTTQHGWQSCKILAQDALIKRSAVARRPLVISTPHKIGDEKGQPNKVIEHD